MNLSIWELISDQANAREIAKLTNLPIEIVEVGLQQWARRGSGYIEPHPIKKMYKSLEDTDIEGLDNGTDQEIKLVLRRIQDSMGGENG